MLVNFKDSFESKEWKSRNMVILIYDTTLQIRAGQRSITANLRPLNAHIYNVMIIVTGGVSKKSFFIFTIS